jgi:hypothetical protein
MPDAHKTGYYVEGPLVAVGPVTYRDGTPVKGFFKATVRLDDGGEGTDVECTFNQTRKQAPDWVEHETEVYQRLAGLDVKGQWVRLRVDVGVRKPSQERLYELWELAKERGKPAPMMWLVPPNPEIRLLAVVELEASLSVATPHSAEA